MTGYSSCPKTAIILISYSPLGGMVGLDDVDGNIFNGPVRDSPRVVRAT